MNILEIAMANQILARHGYENPKQELYGISVRQVLIRLAVGYLAFAGVILALAVAAVEVTPERLADGRVPLADAQ
jgi:hypothetical protein